MTSQQAPAPPTMAVVAIEEQLVVWVDRLVSSISSDDVENALESLLAAMDGAAGSNAAAADAVIDYLLQQTDEQPILAALTSLVRTGQTSNDSSMPPSESCRSLAIRLLTKMTSRTTSSTTTTTGHGRGSAASASGRAHVVQFILDREEELHALAGALDVACDSELPVTARILSIRLLLAWTKLVPSTAIAKWLSTPNGIHRAVDLLRNDGASSDNQEMIQSEALQLAVELSRHSAVAKIWIFADIIPIVLQLSMNTQGGSGLTGGSIFVADCLQVVQNIFDHTDANSAALVLEDTSVYTILAQFLDLRQGEEFIRPPKKAAVAVAPAAPVEDDDDLDALLSSNDTNNNNKSSTNKKKVPRKVIVPKLLPSEEAIISQVLDILKTILDHEKLRQEFLRRQQHLLFLLWELALFVLPTTNDNDDHNATPKFFCAVPSAALQRRTIHLLADGLSSSSSSLSKQASPPGPGGGGPITTTALDSLNRHGGLDRVLYMVCTTTDRGVGQALLYLVRAVLPTQVANEMLMECLAPAPDHYVHDEDEDNGQTTRPATQQPQQQRPGIVKKLLVTAISQLSNNAAAHDNNNDNDRDELMKNETLLVGSLGALGLFLTDDAQRSILYKITLRKTMTTNNSNETTNGGNNQSPPESELLTGLWTCLQKRAAHVGTTEKDQQQQQKKTDDFVDYHLWRFLALWMTDAVLAELLQNADAAQFLMTASQQQQSDLAALIVGMGLLYLNDERQCGGWTKASLLQAMQPHQQWNQKMDRLCREEKDDAEPKSSSSSSSPKGNSVKHRYWFFRPEEMIWHGWCERHVLLIRQQVVREMTTSFKNSGSDQDLALSKIVDDQSHELDTLRSALAVSQRRVEAQGKGDMSGSLALMVAVVSVVFECVNDMMMMSCISQAFLSSFTTTRYQHQQIRSWPLGRCACKAIRPNWISY
jgi:hypothetical protein